jgi:hypothetical protein
MSKALKLGAQNPREQAFPYYTRVVKVFSFEFESTSLHQRTAWSTYEFESTSLHGRTMWSTALIWGGAGRSITTSFD